MPTSTRMPTIPALPEGGPHTGVPVRCTVAEATGAITVTVPIPTSPGRAGFGPALTLSYDGGGGCGAYGPGWRLDLPRLDTADLVPADLVPGRWLPRLVTAPVRIDRPAADRWRLIDRHNRTTWYAEVAGRWLATEQLDGRGNAIGYEYEPDGRPRRIRYGNTVSRLVRRGGGWLFEVVFDYGADLRCRRVSMVHHFPLEEAGRDCLVRATEFGYTGDLLTSVSYAGFLRRSGQAYRRRALPPLRLSYSGGQLSGIDNGLGARTGIAYLAGSARVGAVCTTDAVSGSIWTSTYDYRAGGLVERTDNATYGPALAADPAAQPPAVLTRRWYHPGTAGAAGGTWLPASTAPEGGWPALRGRLQRTEVYALDGSPAQHRPYRVVEHCWRARRLAPGAYAVHRTQTLTAAHERGTQPRLRHELVLARDRSGNVLRAATVAYGRPDGGEPTRSWLTVRDHTNGVDLPDAYRAPVCWRRRRYELGDLGAAGGLVTPARLRAAVPAGDPVVRYQVRFRRDDLTGPLPDGVLEPLALPEHARYAAAALSPAGELAHARTHFFRPYRTGPTQVGYDRYHLLVTGVTSGAGELVGARYDYRALAPRLLVDARGVRREVCYDALGRVAAVAAGGASLAGVDPETAEVDLWLADPAADPAAALGPASTRICHDDWAYLRCGQPAATVTLRRDGPTEVGYADGLGRTVQRVVRRDGRWVGLGRTVYDLAGNALLAAAPYATGTPGYEPDRAPVGPVRCRDPLGRVVAVLHPDDTFEKTVYGAWERQEWDRNDTVLLDPRTDPDAGGYLRWLLAGRAGWQTWHAARAGGALGWQAERAAALAARHAGTPVTVRPDAPRRGAPPPPARTPIPVGGPVRHVEHNARGQCVRLELANGVRLVFGYEAGTFRLNRVRVRRGAEVLQELGYTYDPVGNLTSVRDHAPRARAGQSPPRHSGFRYDEHYRLVEATGRDSGGRYQQRYGYDAAGEVRLLPAGTAPQPRRGAADGEPLGLGDFEVFVVRGGYRLVDRLGGSVLELDGAGQVTGYREQYPFGGTAYEMSTVDSAAVVRTKSW